jgi:2-keto-4-pentenoate hydratase/2-oxohepta-3-ene-1,7-dioic acid hydratase in catechol pathway
VKIIRFEYEGKTSYGVVEGTMVQPADGTPFGTFQPIGPTIPLESVKLLSPCKPGKAICIGLNYRDHAVEFGLPIPKTPVFFLKPSTSIIGPFDPIEYPKMSSRVEYEAELVVVVGKKAKNLTADKAHEYILGYTCGNDVTARDLQPKEGQWTLAKSFDTFLPFGPWIETDIDPSALGIRAILNGEVKQSSSTTHLIFTVPELMAYLSAVMTLEPGDIIMTGTPSGVSPMKARDKIVIEIEGIGSLVNTVG